MSTKKTIAIMTETLQGNPFIELTLGLDPFLGATNEKEKTQKKGAVEIIAQAEKKEAVETREEVRAEPGKGEVIHGDTQK